MKAFLEAARQEVVATRGIPAEQSNRVFHRAIVVGLDNAAIERLTELDGGIAVLRAVSPASPVQKTEVSCLVDEIGLKSVNALADKQGALVRADMFGVFVTATAAKAEAERILGVPGAKPASFHSNECRAA